ncbi:MAG: alcohol dehydrogenase catalytic domain-containing protein, partial [Propionibacteriaceae bacterium]|nr:alcohol dehydrogenase catalytic domain-containing protein [Propionibacteriaceae bacterium]
MKAVIATAAGGPEVLEYTDVPEPVAGPGQVLVKVDAAGVNFIDTYRRSGIYKMNFPHVVGSEGSGHIVALGQDVTDVAVGDTVAWASAPGSYAEYVVVDDKELLPVPEGMDMRVAGALPLQ